MAKITLADRLSLASSTTLSAPARPDRQEGILARARRKLAGQKGALTLAEVIGAIIIGSVVLAQQFPIVAETTNLQKDVITGGQLGDYGLAATRFIGDNWTNVLAAVPAVGNTTAIPMTLIRDGGILGGSAVTGGYIPAAANLQNNYQQDYALCVQRTSTTDVTAILLTQNGREIPFDRLASAAINADWGGGFIRQDAPTEARGIGGTWGPFDLSACAGSGITVAGGRLAYLVALGNGAAVQDWLARRAVPGNPAANRMETNIDANNNDVLNIGEVQTDIGRAYHATEAIFDARIVAAQSNVLKPVCRTGQTPQIFLSPASYSDNGVGSPIAAVRAYATDLGTQWQVNIEVDTALGTVVVNSSYGRLLVVAKCTN